MTRPEQYDELQSMQQAYFKGVISKLEECGANTVLCQWGFDHEANYLMYSHNINAVRWIGGSNTYNIHNNYVARRRYGENCFSYWRKDLFKDRRSKARDARIRREGNCFPIIVISIIRYLKLPWATKEKSSSS
jgi:hypothetical protein